MSISLDQLAIIDVVTTGDDPLVDEVVEVSVILPDRGKAEGPRWHWYLSPLKPLDPLFYQLHPELAFELARAPERMTCISELHQLLKGRLLLGMQMRRQWLFLKQLCKEASLSFVETHLSLEAMRDFSRFHTLRHSENTSKEQSKRSSLSLMKVAEIERTWVSLTRQKDEAEIVSEIKSLLKATATPKRIARSVISNLPKTAGVYLFFDERDCLLYVGKSISIRDRVLQHFYSDTHSSTEGKMKDQVSRIEAISTAGELEALLLEARLIKSEKPIYNRRLRSSEAIWKVSTRLSADGYLKLVASKLGTLRPAEVPEVLAVFRSKGHFEQALRQLADEQQLCRKMLGLEKTTSACFNYGLGLCQGACVGLQPPSSFNLQLLAALAPFQLPPWPFARFCVHPESDQSTGMKTLHVFDQWCYLGTVAGELREAEYQQRRLNAAFNYDEYQIIRRFIAPKA